MKLITGAVFSVLFLSANSFAEETVEVSEENSHVLHYNLDYTRQVDDKAYVGEHFLEYTYGFSNGYSLMTAITANTDLERDDEDNWQDTAALNQARIEWETPKLWDIAGFATSYRLRYLIPVTDEDQESGGYGTFQSRLQMDREFNSWFSLTLIPKFAVHAQRNGYPVRISAVDALEAEDQRQPILSAAIEIVPSFQLTEWLSLTYDADISGAYVGNSSFGNKNTKVLGEFYHEVELNFAFESLSGVNLALVVMNSFSFGNHSNPGLLKDDQTNIGLRINKDFEL